MKNTLTLSKDTQMNTISEVIAHHKAINNIADDVITSITVFDTIKNKTEGWDKITKEKLNLLSDSDLAELLLKKTYGYDVKFVLKNYENITPRVIFALSYAYDWSNYLSYFIDVIKKQDDPHTFINDLMNLYFEKDINDNNRYRNILGNIDSLVVEYFNDEICRTLLKYGVLGQFFEDYFDGYDKYDFDKILYIITKNINIHYVHQTDKYSPYKIPDFVYKKANIKDIIANIVNDENKYKHAMSVAMEVKDHETLIEINDAVPDRMRFYKKCLEAFNSKSGGLYHNEVVRAWIIYVETGFDEKTKVEDVLSTPERYNKDFFINTLGSNLSGILTTMFESENFFAKMDKTLLAELFSDLLYYLRNNNKDEFIVDLLQARGEGLYDLPCVDWGHKPSCFEFLQGYLSRGKYDAVVDFVNTCSNGTITAVKILDELLTIDFTLMNKINVDKIANEQYTWH